jgi:hypothetical protein
MGEFDFPELNELWLKKEEDKNKTLTGMIKDVNREKMEMEENFQKKLDEQISNMDSQN